MLPIDFYYIKKSIEPRYSFTPTGDINVNRLIHNQAYWRQRVASTICENKTLILADWTAMAWTGKKKALVIKKLYELLEAGFNIQIWQSGQIEELTKDNLHDFLNEPQILERMASPAMRSDIEARTIHELPKIVKEQIHILDEYQINGLLQPEVFTTPREIDIADILGSKQDLNKLIPLFEKANPPITSFTDSSVSDESYVVLERLQDLLPKIVIKTHFQSARLTNNIVSQLFLENKAAIGRRTIALSQLQFLEDVELDSLSEQNFQRILPLLPNIKKLTLTRTNLRSDVFLNDNKFMYLEKIKLMDSQVTTKNVHTLMSKTPHLSSFILNKSGLENNFALDSLRLENLDTIKTTQSTFPKENYQQILLKNKAKRLVFRGGSIVSDTLTEKKGMDLSSIKTLEINDSICDSRYLDQMFNALPQLEHVIIVKGHIQSFKSTFSLRALKTLHIDLARFNEIAHSFNDIRIEKLTLIDNCTTTVPNLEKINLVQLKQFQLQKNKINHPFLSKLLRQANALHHLDLQGSTNLSSLDGTINFANIETLNLSGTDISANSLKVILSSALSLKRLDLTGCKIEISSEIEDLLRGIQVYYPDHIKIKKAKPTSFLYTTSSSSTDVYNLFSSGGTPSPSGDTPSPSGDTPSPSGDTPSPSGDTPSPSGDTPSPSGDTPSPSGGTPSPSGGTPSPGNGNGKSSDQGQPTPGVNSYQEGDVEDDPEENEKMDADTSDKDAKFNIKRVFYPLTPGVTTPHPRDYRERLFNNIDIFEKPCSEKAPFELNNKGSLDLIPCDVVSTDKNVIHEVQNLLHSTTHNYFYANKTLNLTQQWRPLPSLNAEEKLTHYHLQSLGSEIEIQYSRRDNQYYIRSKKDKEQVTIDYLIEVPKKDYSLPQDIQTLVDDFNHNYGSGTLKIDKKNPTGRDYLQAIMDQKKGACRHRSVAFYHQIKQQFPNVQIRLVCNKVHMQAEIMADGNWIACNLGGYPATLTIDDSNNPENIPDLPILQTISDKELFQDDANISKYLQTWKKSKQPELSIDDYCKQVLDPRSEKKYLVEMSNKQSNNAFLLAVKEYCKKHNKPLFYIDNPDDLTCSAAYLTNQNNKGIINDGPGGPLHSFLTAKYDKSNPPILLINYENFDADDIVRHNSLYEDIQKADGTLLPPGTIILSTTNISKPNVYLGEDLTSRMDKHEPCPLSERTLNALYPELELKPFENESRKTVPINLFHAENWKDLLLGQWIVDGNGLYFEDGILKTALSQNAVINIQNGLWEDDAFKQFWQEALINRYIDYEGQRIQLPEHFDFVVQEGYDLDMLKPETDCHYNPNVEAEVLNPTRFNLFFSQYQPLETTKGLQKIPGIIERYAGKTLAINLTRDITADEWARFLTECKKHNVKAEPTLIDESVSVWDKSLSPLMVIGSSDRDSTIYQLTQELKEYEFIDASELEASDVLEQLSGSYDKKTHKFEFRQIPKVLNKALKENKNIILTGTLSDALLDSLMPILYARVNNPEAKGKLALVIDESMSQKFPFLTTHQVSSNEKLEILGAFYKDSDLQCLTQTQLDNEELSQLKARIRCHQQHSEEKDTSKAWDGLYALSSQIKLPAFDLNHSADKVKKIIDQRINTIRTMLSQSPMLYLSGLTGVGKTTFITKYLSNLSDINLYVGEEKLTEWALDKSDKMKIIFIDEANIGKRQWSEFEGLFQDSPSIVIDGQQYLLSKDGKHVVIFAGNPLNYGSERQLAPLFRRHGNAMVIEPMIGEFIYEEILKPLFEKTTLEAKAKDVSSIVLSVYKYLVNQSTKEVLISARELQLMTLLTLSYHHKHPDADYHQIAAHYAYQIGKTMVPYEKTQEFEERFKPKKALHPVNSASFKLEGASYLITPSRHEIYNLINDLLSLRQFKKYHCHNNAQKFGGIGALILEGEPGIGKSELINALLGVEGFNEGALNFDPDGEDISYHIPISMRNEDRQSLSLKGLENAAVSVIDEINSSPFAERWFNDLFMGINPVTKKYPETPGSLMFLTQNPVTMAGRQRPSNALSRRVITYSLPPYPPEEMVSILINEGVEAKLAAKMVEIYINLVNYAHRKYLTPAPTFRNLLRLGRIASNSKQKEALDNFFTKVQIPSLRQALLNAEKRFKSNTVLALIQHLTPEILAFFEMNIDLFDSFVVKAMSEEKVQFMLQTMTLLNKGFGALDKEKVKYFELMSNLPLDEIKDVSSLNTFFSEKPDAIQDFFKKSSTIELSLLITFIQLFNDSELIAAILANDRVDSDTLLSYLLESTFYMKEFVNYKNTHPDADGHCMEKVLQLARFIKEKEQEARIPLYWSAYLAKASPDTIEWFVSLMDENNARVDALAMFSLLRNISDEKETRLLNKNPLYLNAIILHSLNDLKVRFLLDSLLLIDNVPDLSDVERVKYFEILRDLDVDYRDQIFEVLSQDPVVWPVFFKKIHALPLAQVLGFFITFKNNPEIILGLEHGDNELIEQFNYLVNFPELNNIIIAKFKENPQSCQGILKLVSFLAQNLPAEQLYIRTNETLLIEAPPRTVEFIINSLMYKHDLLVTKRVIHLLEYLTEESIYFFEQNPDVLDVFMTTEMTSETAKLSSYILNVLLKDKGLSDVNIKRYYQKLTQIPIKYAYLGVLEEFLSSEPKALNSILLLSELNPSSLGQCLFFIHKFNQYPKLMKELLSDHDFIVEFLSAHDKDALVYTLLINSYMQYHPGISESTLLDLLRVACPLRESGIEDSKYWTQNLAYINPNRIKLIANLLKRDKTQVNYQNIIPMLQHASEDAVIFFEEKPSILDHLISKTISTSQIKFLLKVLYLLLNKEGERLPAIINYFNQMVDLPLGSFHFDYEPLAVLLAQKPELISLVMKKSKSINCDSLMQLLTALMDFPDLICKILEKDVDSRLIKSAGDIPVLYAPLLKNYASRNSNVSVESLEQVLELALYLNSHFGNQRYLWQPVIANAHPDKIKKFSGWMTQYDPHVCLNLICSNAEKMIFINPSPAKEHFIIKFTKQLLNNISSAFFDFSKPFRFDKERAMFLHHLEQETFVVDGDDESLWTKEKNEALLQQAYANYTSLFSKEAKKQNTEVLLMVSKELSEVSRVRGYSISNKVTKDLDKAITGYQWSFWIRNQRKQSAASLKKLINQKNMDYPKILEAIANARDDVFTNDTQKERNMHRFGSSRYYDTLNKLEEILINAWIQDKDAISGFKAYLPYYEKTLAHNKKCIKDAIQYEQNKNNRKYDYQTAFNNCPGYIRALAKEAMTREKVLEQYYEAMRVEERVVPVSAS